MIRRLSLYLNITVIAKHQQYQQSLVQHAANKTEESLFHKISKIHLSYAKSLTKAPKQGLKMISSFQYKQKNITNVLYFEASA